MAIIHRILDNDSDRTVCGILAWEAPRKGGRAPLLSTNSDHITCSKCKGETK